VQTNNPRKIQVLQELGVDVTGRIPCIVESQELNVGYLATKQVCIYSTFFTGCANLDLKEVAHAKAFLLAICSTVNRARICS